MERKKKFGVQAKSEKESNSDSCTRTCFEATSHILAPSVSPPLFPKRAALPILSTECLKDTKARRANLDRCWRGNGRLENSDQTPLVSRFRSLALQVFFSRMLYSPFFSAVLTLPCTVHASNTTNSSRTTLLHRRPPREKEKRNTTEKSSPTVKPQPNQKQRHRKKNTAPQKQHQHNHRHFLALEALRNSSREF